MEPRSPLVISGASELNLKSITCRISLPSFTCVTGPSGAGKSALVFGTIEAFATKRAEILAGESPNDPARPRVEQITGLPLVRSLGALPLRFNRLHAVNLLGLTDSLGRLVAREAERRCPSCGERVSQTNLARALEKVFGKERAQATTQVFVTVHFAAGGEKAFSEVQRAGYSRALIGGELAPFDAFSPDELPDIDVVIDAVRPSAPRHRAAEAARLGAALLQASGVRGSVRFYCQDSEKKMELCCEYAEEVLCTACGRTQREISPSCLVTSHPAFRCPRCDGAGELLTFDAKHLRSRLNPRSLKKLARALGESGEVVAKELEEIANREINTEELCEPAALSRTLTSRNILKQKGILGRMAARFAGSKSKSVQEVIAAFYRREACLECRGTGFLPEVVAAQLRGTTLKELLEAPADELFDWWKGAFEGDGQRDSASVLRALSRCNEIGTGHISLSRKASSLSSGEVQRLRLASLISEAGGSAALREIVLLDEPCAALHPKDSAAVANSISELVLRGASAIVVEHSKELIERSSSILELGPGSGPSGGEVVAHCAPSELSRLNTLTGKQLRGEFHPRRIDKPELTRFLELSGIRRNNLKVSDVRFPINALTLISGVSGSGKSSLLTSIAETASGLTRKYPLSESESLIDAVSYFSAKIRAGRRGTVASLLGAMRPVLMKFAESEDARTMGLSRPAALICSTCRGVSGAGGSGCGSCHGTGIAAEARGLVRRGLKLTNLPSLSLSEAKAAFGSHPDLRGLLGTADELGIGYLRFFQPASSLSAGEKQRLRLAAIIRPHRRETKRLIVLDEPTRGMDPRQALNLLMVLRELSKTHTVVAADHSDALRAGADYLIELGPGAGKHGGTVTFAGSPSTQ